MYHSFFIHLSVIISMISEVNQTEEVKYHDITYMYNQKPKIQMNFIYKTNRPTDIEIKLMANKEGGDKLGGWD